MSEYLNHLGEVAQPFTWPGQRGWETRDANLQIGVPIHADIVAQLAEVGVRLSL
jgi:LDH2 family malate/lactate/ureidoglycolate dehydrogenase